MSRKKTEQEYRKTFAFRFFRWLNAEEDRYLDKVEMHPQEPYVETEEDIRRRQREKNALLNKLYGRKKSKSVRYLELFYKGSCIVFCGILIYLLLLTVSYLPPIGVADRPVNNEVSRRYIEEGLDETGAVNIVSGMILDYRAFDTLGESHVLFVATVTVLILLRADHKKKEQSSAGEEMAYSLEEAEINDRNYEPKNDAILQMAACILVPIIIIFGIYVILNGHLGPGGGFSGGAIIGAGLILYLNAFGFQKTQRFFTEKTYKWVSFGSLSFYCIAKSYSFYTGANHLENIIPKGTPGAILSSGLILPLNIAVGLVVACTMYAFYVMFRKGGF